MMPVARQLILLYSLYFPADNCQFLSISPSDLRSVRERFSKQNKHLMACNLGCMLVVQMTRIANVPHSAVQKLSEELVKPDVS